MGLQVHMKVIVPPDEWESLLAADEERNKQEYIIHTGTLYNNTFTTLHIQTNIDFSTYIIRKIHTFSTHEPMRGAKR